MPCPFCSRSDHKFPKSVESCKENSFMCLMYDLGPQLRRQLISPLMLIGITDRMGCWVSHCVDWVKRTTVENCGRLQRSHGLLNTSFDWWLFDEHLCCQSSLSTPVFHCSNTESSTLVFSAYIQHNEWLTVCSK